MSDKLKVTIVKPKKTESAVSFEQWYAENKEEYNEKRRKKYANDPYYRKKAIASAKHSYWKKRMRNESEIKNLPVLKDFKPYMTKEITIQNEDDVRYGQTVTVNLYRTHELAVCLGRSDQTYRLWIRRGYVPEAMFSHGKFRLVTEDQAEAIIGVRNYMAFPYKELADWVFFKKVRKALAEMPDGVKVLKKDSVIEKP